MRVLFFWLTFSVTACLCGQQSVDPSALELEIQSVESSLIPSIIVKDEAIPKFTLADRMAHHNVPGVSLAIIEGGTLKWAKGYGIANSNTGSSVTTETLFQAGSISKPLAALAALKLVEEGKIDLDTDVNTYLKEWQIPETDLTKTEKVTLRRLLTHTAGLTVHGFGGYKKTDEFPSVVQVLNGDSNNAAVVVDIEPGSQWRYSGGGYTVMDLLVEDLTGKSMAEYWAENIGPELDMSNSLYAQPLPEELHGQASAAYDIEGEIIEGEWNSYAALGAAGLWTTPTDLAKYCIEIQEIIAGKEDGVLSKPMVEAMLTKDKNDWGLGPSLRGEGNDLTFGHGGKNAGFSNVMTAFVYKGNGAIVMTNGDYGTRLMTEIMLAISNYYGWDFIEPQTLELFEMTDGQLEEFTGTYVCKDIPGVDEYIADIELKDGRLVIYDRIEDETIPVYPINKREFKEIADGDVYRFQRNIKKKLTGFKYNNNFVFRKISD